MEDRIIKQYTINISEEHLANINAKVAAYDWSLLPDVGGWKAGVGLRDLKQLVTYWLDLMIGVKQSKDLTN